MTKTYELFDERMIMADVDEKRHAATVDVFVLEDLINATKDQQQLKAVLDEIKEELHAPNKGTHDLFIRDRIDEIIDKYETGGEEEEDLDIEEER